MDQHLDRMQRRVDELTRKADDLASMAADLHQVVGEMRKDSKQLPLPGIGAEPSAVEAETARLRARVAELESALRGSEARLERLTAAARGAASNFAEQGPGWLVKAQRAREMLDSALFDVTHVSCAALDVPHQEITENVALLAAEVPQLRTRVAELEGELKRTDDRRMEKAGQWGAELARRQLAEESVAELEMENERLQGALREAYQRARDANWDGCYRILEAEASGLSDGGAAAGDS